MQKIMPYSPETLAKNLVTIPQGLASDHQATASLHKMIQKLGAKTTMILYDSLISGKRILISGDTR